jgi:mRNA deadenylase 3'-5' endonuclease subunit Ccr4
MAAISQCLRLRVDFLFLMFCALDTGDSYIHPGLLLSLGFPRIPYCTLRSKTFQSLTRDPLSRHFLETPRPVTLALSTKAKASIMVPREPFHDTQSEEISIVSCNLLAPTLHSLNFPAAEREVWAMEDRKERVPKAFSMVKRLNADILCLQEVEGGLEYRESLQQLLMDNECVDGTEIAAGYDQFVWSRLHPKREGEVVGLCVAWRARRFTVCIWDVLLCCKCYCGWHLKLRRCTY